MTSTHRVRRSRLRSRKSRLGAVGAVLVGVVITGALLAHAVPGSGGPPMEDPPRPRAAPVLQTFPTLPPGSPLPSGEECAQRVDRDPFEPRPANTAANNATPPVGYAVPRWEESGYAPELDDVVIPRIDGRFTGTTNEIIAWGACKWGFDADMIRAMAVEESSWRQSLTGDEEDDQALCVPGDVAPCPTSFGLLQVKHTFRPGSYPYSLQNTAFNVDYALGVVRACYEGWVTYLENGYAAGDEWGCLGWHFSGEWRDDQALGYIDRVQEHLDGRPWLGW